MDNRTKATLLHAKSEIQGLRRENEILRAKVETLDTIAGLLNGRAGHSMTMGENVVWAIDELLANNPDTSAPGQAGEAAAEAEVAAPNNQ